MGMPDQLSTHQEKIVVGVVPIDVDQGQVVLLVRAGEEEGSSERDTETGYGIG